jgi:type III pantothenate kinase
MFLAIDIGNTTTMIGFFDKGELKGSFRVASSHAVTSDECGILIKQLLEFHAGNNSVVRKIGISSVVPTLTQIYVSMSQKYFNIEPLLLNHRTELGFKILYDDPRQVGADRLANAVAVRKLYSYPAIIIDLGTATTYDIIDVDGNYAGGLIAPGVWTSASNLFRKAARLFPVKLERPHKLIGTDTADSMKSGIYYGFIGQMDYLVNRIKNETGYSSVKVIATGGYSDVFAEDSDTIQIVDVSLTLKGLQIIFDE